MPAANDVDVAFMRVIIAHAVTHAPDLAMFGRVVLVAEVAVEFGPVRAPLRDVEPVFVFAPSGAFFHQVEDAGFGHCAQEPPRGLLGDWIADRGEVLGGVAAIDDVVVVFEPADDFWPAVACGSLSCTSGVIGHALVRVGFR